MPKPRPITTEQICSECELDWKLHPKNPTLSDCINLLKSRPQPICVLPHYPYTCNRTHYPPPQIWYGTGTAQTWTFPQLNS